MADNGPTFPHKPFISPGRGQGRKGRNGQGEGGWQASWGWRSGIMPRRRSEPSRRGQREGQPFLPREATPLELGPIDTVVLATISRFGNGDGGFVVLARIITQWKMVHVYDLERHAALSLRNRTEGHGGLS